MSSYLVLLVELFQDYGLFLIFPLLFLENLPFIGFFTPAITVLFLAGYFLTSDIASLILVITVAYLAVVISDNLLFWIGHVSRGKWHWLRQVTEQSPDAEHVLTHQSLYVLLFYQFIPYFRMFLPYAFGIFLYNIRSWFTINLIGSFLYAATFVLLGALAKRTFRELGDAHIVTKILNVVIIMIAILYGAILVNRYIKRRKR